MDCFWRQKTPGFLNSYRPLITTLEYFTKLFLHCFTYHVCVCIHMHVCAYRHQRTICKSWSSPLLCGFWGCSWLTSEVGRTLSVFQHPHAKPLMCTWKEDLHFSLLGFELSLIELLVTYKNFPFQFWQEYRFIKRERESQNLKCLYWEESSKTVVAWTENISICLICGTTWSFM